MIDQITLVIQNFSILYTFSFKTRNDQKSKVYFRNNYSTSIELGMLYVYTGRINYL